MSTHNTCKTRTRECESLVGKYSCESEFGFSEPKYSRVRVRVTHECTRGQPYPVKNDEEGLKNLWAGQQKLLEAFDLQFPDQRQPALTVPPALPTFPALQARLAPPTEALTITPAISPPAGPAPIPISHPPEVLHPKPAQFTNPS